MTKSDDKRVPALRFKGFTDDWEQRKLGDLTQKIKSYPISHDAEINTITGTKYIHYGDIHTGKLKRITNEKILPNINDNNYIPLKSGDVIVADASEDYKGIADACVIDLMKEHYKIVSGLHTIVFRPNERLKSDFLYTYFHTPIFKHYGYRVGTGLKVFGITYNNLSNMEIKLPKIDEQNKVYKIINIVTNIITLQQRKVTLLKRLKRTLLNSLISGKDAPLVRFKEFKSNWTVFKLEDIVAKTIKGNAKAEMHGKESIYLDTHYLNGGNPTKVDSPTNVFSDDIIILWDGSQAGKVYHGFSGALGSTLKSFTPKYSSDYLFQYLKKYQNKIFVNYRTPNIPHVIKDFTTIFKVNLPSTKEQITISKLLKTVDAQITTKSDSITYLKNMKQFLLQNMFI
ncbi:restriction endonuclease subunit S [Lactobacillus taiwanensis]|uniref:restriction endonuclease subunit S n=1 Tax=Lactobacillus taiwanensis TaxID=508451 RepID=UPI00273080C4|nr:restriction endonuclease subunit S [Lactobacillus taiwanensis]